MSREGDDSGADAPTLDSLLGRIVGPYRIVEALTPSARVPPSALGAVRRYVGWHVLLHKKVALAVLPPEVAHDADAVERFLGRARGAARVHSPHVVSVLDLGESSDGYLYLASELCDGPDLATLAAARGPLPWAEARAIAREVAAALLAARAEGVPLAGIDAESVFLGSVGVKVDLGGALPAAAPAADASEESGREGGIDVVLQLFGQLLGGEAAALVTARGLGGEARPGSLEALLAALDADELGAGPAPAAPAIHARAERVAEEARASAPRARGNDGDDDDTRAMERVLGGRRRSLALGGVAALGTAALLMGVLVVQGGKAPPSGASAPPSRAPVGAASASVAPARPSPSPSPSTARPSGPLVVPIEPVPPNPVPPAVASPAPPAPPAGSTTAVAPTPQAAAAAAAAPIAAAGPSWTAVPGKVPAASPAVPSPSGGARAAAAETEVEAAASEAGPAAGAADARPCRVTLGSRPWAEVWVDGKHVGFTPLANHALACGPHDVVLRNPDLGVERRLTVVARAGETVRRMVELPLPPRTGGDSGSDGDTDGYDDRRARDAVGTACLVSVGSRPWAEVWIDGRRAGVTPLVDHDLPCGRHELVLRNRDLNMERREAIDIQAGEHLRKVIRLASSTDDD